MTLKQKEADREPRTSGYPAKRLRRALRALNKGAAHPLLHGNVPKVQDFKRLYHEILGVAPVGMRSVRPPAPETGITNDADAVVTIVRTSEAPARKKDSG